MPNLYYVLKYSGMKPNWSGWLIRPGIATLCMGAAVYLLRAVLPVSRLCTLAEVAVGVAVYLGAALACKAITREDFASLRRLRRAFSALQPHRRRVRLQKLRRLQQKSKLLLQ